MNTLEPMQATDAETSLLGAAMSGADIDELAEVVQAGDFYDPRRGSIWTAIMRVHAAGNKPDVISVRLALEASGDKHDPLELFRMVELVPIVAQADYYAQQVATAAGHRALATAGIKVTQLGNTLGELDERREQARAAVEEACAGRTVTRMDRFADVLPEVLDIAQNGRPGSLGTGWPDIDELIGGIAPGRLIVVGGRPGAGKSLFGTNMALHVGAHHHHAALVCSIEMSQAEITQRMLAAHARVNLTGLINGHTDERSWERIAAANDSITAMPVYYECGTSARTVQGIRSRARTLHRTRDDLALIVVDYLQLMDVTGENRAQGLGNITRDLKVLAGDLGVCVLLLAQVNRESTKRGDRPRMSDLRESGAIEADADQVLLLHQPDEKIPEVEVVVDKNRHGPKGIRTLAMWGHYATLASLARPGQMAAIGQ